MGVNDSQEARPLGRIQRVRCLSCSASYVKPVGGGTVSANPGCPECGYVGWVLEHARLIQGAGRSHFFGDRQRRRSG
jgi:hypothetical protein